MSTALTTEQKKAIKAKLLSGELDPNGPEAKSLVARKFKEDVLGFAKTFLQEHITDQATHKPTDSPLFHSEMIELYGTNRFVALAAPRG